VIVGDQLRDVAGGVEEVERRGAAIGVDDRRTFLDVGIVVEGEQRVPLLDPAAASSIDPRGMLIA
jgi:hypothetical protein